MGHRGRFDFKLPRDGLCWDPAPPPPPPFLSLLPLRRRTASSSTAGAAPRTSCGGFVNAVDRTRTDDVVDVAAAARLRDHDLVVPADWAAKQTDKRLCARLVGRRTPPLSESLKASSDSSCSLGVSALLARRGCIVPEKLPNRRLLPAGQNFRRAQRGIDVPAAASETLRPRTLLGFACPCRPCPSAHEPQCLERASQRLSSRGRDFG